MMHVDDLIYSYLFERLTNRKKSFGTNYLTREGDEWTILEETELQTEDDQITRFLILKTGIFIF